VYQVFTRLFGNKNTNNKPWGTIEENGVGKFNDLQIKHLMKSKLGRLYLVYRSHIMHWWNYTQLVFQMTTGCCKRKSRLSYAVKDYYNVDLAVSPANRLVEFEALIARTHKAGLKLIIDIVPNHIARKYEGKKSRRKDFGVNDDVTVAYKEIITSIIFQILF
jgi:glycosidase